MTPLIYSAIDPNALGPGLETQLNGQIVTVNTINTDLHRMARGTEPKKAGAWFFEAAFYIDPTVSGAPTSLAGLASVGVVTGTASLSKYVGEDAQGIGYKAGNGNVYTNNATATNLLTGVTVNPTTFKTVIGILLDLTAQTVTFYISGSIAGTFNLPVATTSWYPAVSVSVGSGGNAYAVKCFLNFGQRAFSNAPPGVDGWYIVGTSNPVPVYLTTVEEGGYTSANTDSPQNQIYAPRVLNGDSFSISRMASVWQWGERSGSVTYGQIEIDNFKGAYDYMLKSDYRDSILTCKIVANGGALSGATTIATAIVDKVAPPTGADGERKIIIYLRDVMTQYEVPLQKKLFPPYVDPGTANRPQPIILGAARQCEPVPVQTNADGTLLYALGDAPITNVPGVRDKGALLDPNAPQGPQYYPSGDQTGLILATPPVGILTTDISSRGSQVVIPGADDVLSGSGAFTSWTAGVPTGWTKDSVGADGSLTQLGLADGSPQNYVARLSAATGITFAAGSHYGFWLKSPTAVLLPGSTYIITIKLVSSIGYPSTGTPFGFIMYTAQDASPGSWITPYQQPCQTAAYNATKTLTFEYKCPNGAARYIYLATVADGSSNGPCAVIVYGLKIELLPAYSAAQMLPLKGISLTDYMTEILENRAGIDSSKWVSADTAAIDAAAPYTIGTRFVDPITTKGGIFEPLDSYCATAITDSLGRIRIRRFINPSTGTPVASFDFTNTEYGVSCVPDYAKGLTTLIGARKNWKVVTDTDLVSDYTIVPSYLRTQWKREHQFILTSAHTPAGSYSFALSAPELDSRIDDPTQAQAEIDRVLINYDVANGSLPNFYTFTTLYRGAPPDLLFGDVVAVTYPRFNLNNTYLLVKDIVIYPALQKITITAWG